MIPRSPSRRRRISRSGGSSPQPARPTRQLPSPTVSPGRRASIAVSPVDIERVQYHMLAPEMINRTPRHSIIPDISLDTRSDSSNEDVAIPMTRSHSARNSLDPDSSRGHRHSFVPNDYSRSPRNSLIPENARSRRSSLLPEVHYNRSPRSSLVPEVSKSPRLSPDQASISRSPRHSLVPDTNGSRLNLDQNRSPRNSLQPDGSRESRNFRISDDEITWAACSSDEMQNLDRSPRHNIAPDGNRSPRGSITYERPRSERTSPRGSLANEYIDRSPRGSLGGEGHNRREPKMHICENHTFDISNDLLDRKERKPRGSLTLAFQDCPSYSPRRYSTDYGQNVRTATPYRVPRGNLNQGYTQSKVTCNESGSRRASSSVSQVSGDEHKRLFSDKNYVDGGSGTGIPLTSLATYGSVAYQLKDANLEANDTCDFLCRAMKVLNKSAAVSVILVFLSVLPVIMLIMGAQFLRDCPKEPHIPVYMLVGGIVGCIKMAWVLWNQLYTRRHTVVGVPERTNVGSRILSCLITCFLISWFVLGNYWILRIKWPDFSPTLFEPNLWCHRALYGFAIAHLFIIYGIVVIIVLLMIVLAGCQAFGCAWLSPGSAYK